VWLEIIREGGKANTWRDELAEMITEAFDNKKVSTSSLEAAEYKYCRRRTLTWLALVSIEPSSIKHNETNLDYQRSLLC
jgi:hypothetical protein